MKKKTILIIVLFAAGLNSSRAQDTWTQKADFGGTGRYQAVGFSIGSKGYIGTGRSLTNYPTTYYNDFWEFDPSTNTWTQKANFGGTVRRAAVGFSIDSKGYIGTGQDQSYNFKSDFWEYDPTANTWTQKAEFGGTARFFATGFSIGSKGYIGIGLDDGGYPKDFWEYDPAVNTWTQKIDFGGNGRYAATGFSIGSKGYIGTGFDNTLNFKKDFWEYDPYANTWTQKSDFGGTTRHLAVGFNIGSKGYIGTGYGNGMEYNDFWEYDPTINVWIQKSDYGGGFHSSATGLSIDNKGYIGTGSSYLTYYNDFWEYTHDAMANCNIPTSLSTINIPATKVKLQWNAVSEAIGYKVRYKIAGTSEWTNIQSIDNDKTLKGLSASTEYVWQVKSICSTMPVVSSEWSEKQFFTTGSLRSGAMEDVLFPIEVDVYPNPFMVSTTISFSLQQTSAVTIELFDMAGRVVHTLIDEELQSGSHEFTFDRAKLPAGIYLLKMQTPSSVMTQSIIVQ